MVPPNSQFTTGATNAPGLSAPALARAIDSALAWWQMAGVDCDYTDVPHNWLAAEPPVAHQKKVADASPQPLAPVAIAGGPQAWPAELAAFAPWWMTEPALALANAARVPPCGPHAPALMVVVPMPEAEDKETLLSGPAGHLLDGFLHAAGLHRAQVYIAAALPARIAAPDWADLAAQGLGRLLAHHIALVQPQRLLIFGQSGISTLLRGDSTHKPTDLPTVNHNSVTPPTLAAFDLEMIAARPALKAGLWSRWLDWMPA